MSASTEGAWSANVARDLPLETCHLCVVAHSDAGYYCRQPEVLLSMSLRIALCGPSGAGKTTFAHFLCSELMSAGRPAVHLRIAEPLYQLQQDIYRTAGVDVPLDGFQDTKLLSMLGRHLRAINSDALLHTFRAQVAGHSGDSNPLRCGSTAIICSDARRPDLAALDELRFDIAFISAPTEVLECRLHSRGDINAHAAEPVLEVIDSDWEWDYEIYNVGSMDQLQESARRLCQQLMRDAA